MEELNQHREDLGGLLKKSLMKATPYFVEESVVISGQDHLLTNKL